VSIGNPVSQQHDTASGDDYTVRLIDPSCDKRWDTFVEKHPWGWICQLSDWGKILEECFKHITGYYLALFDDNDRIRAGLPIFSVKSWLTGSRMVSVPHGTLCDPLVDNPGQMDQLVWAAIGLAKTLRISQIEIKTLMSSPLISENILDKDSYYKHHYLRLVSDPEQLRKSFHRTCVRQRITRALNSKLEVRVARSVSDLDDFYQLHVHTRKRHGLPPQPFRLFELLWDTLHPLNRITALTAFLGDVRLASLILLKFKNRVSAEFAASDERFFNLSPNHLLFWEAIKLACHEGFEIFDFGRTPPTNQELMDFKRRWGTEMVDLSHFFYPKQLSGHLRQDSKFAYRAAQTLCLKIPNRFLPLFGQFVYKHLG